jgi:hypothetical protein
MVMWVDECGPAIIVILYLFFLEVSVHMNWLAMPFVDWTRVKDSHHLWSWEFLVHLNSCFNSSFYSSSSSRC